MGKFYHLTPVVVVCTTLWLSGCASNHSNLKTAQANTNSDPVYQALPLVQGAQAPRPRPAPRYQARQQTVVARRPARRQFVQVAQRPPAALMNVQRASYIPAVSSHYTLDQDFDTWTRVFRSFRLGDYSSNPRVQQFIQSYAQNPAQLSILSERASLFLHMIIAELERRGMPAELALLPFVESGFDPDVFSHAGAAGLWQFIPSTGRDYGLKQVSNYDARMDPFAATGAALNYLQKLQRQFNGDWLLALAAYNCGENCVSRAISKARSAGRPSDFWNLSLPKETMNYVPRLLAFKELIGNARRYNIRLPVTPNSAKLAQMRINKPVSLRQAALQAGLPANRLLELNPCFRTGITTPEHSNRIILPREHADRLVQVIRALPPAYAQPAYAAWRGSSPGG